MQSINYELALPEYINAMDIRKFIIRSIFQKGEVIRWSIYDIVISRNKKILKINALILD